MVSFYYIDVGYYIYGSLLLHLWLELLFMVDYYIYGDTASQLGAGDLIGSQCTQKGVYEIYI